MGDTISIRASEETKALFKEIMEGSSFENHGDFLNRLLTQYQAETTKKTASMLRPAIEAVETLTGRLFEILNGAGATIAVYEENHVRELDGQRISFDETRALLQQKITSLEQGQSEYEKQIQSLLSDKEADKAKLDEFQQQMRHLENAISDKSALIEEYKEKNDALNSIVSEYKDAAMENRKLSMDVNSLKHENMSLQGKIDGFAGEIEHIKNSLMMDKDKALLQLKQEYQNKAEEQLVKHSAMISDYENRVRELLSLSNGEKSTSAKAAKSSPSAGRPKKAAEQKVG